MIRDEGYRMYNQSNIKVSYEDIVTLMEYLEDNYLINSEFISYFKDRYLDLPKLRAEEKEAYNTYQKALEILSKSQENETEKSALSYLNDFKSEYLVKKAARMELADKVDKEGKNFSFLNEKKENRQISYQNTNKR